MVDGTTGIYSTSSPTPTGIPSDPQLAAYGVEQAKQLADKIITLDPPVDIVYSSPFYRCLQTIEPTVKNLTKAGRTDGKVRVENGVGEFFGTARFEHPAPATLDILHRHFDFLDPSYEPVIRPNPNGETLPNLLDRHAYALHRIIETLDAHESKPRALLICTHAASMICIGRVLTGRKPNDIDEVDFNCGTCALSKFVRRNYGKQDPVEWWDMSRPGCVPKVDWEGKGVAGGWDCVLNGDCSFLTNGEERTWTFGMEAQFVGNHKPGGEDAVCAPRPIEPASRRPC